MSKTRVAIRYAKAVIDFAQEKQEIDEVHNNMTLVIATIKQNIKLQQLLNSPIVKNEIKKKITIEIFGKSITQTTQKLIYLLLKNKRLNLVVEVAKQYIILYNKLKEKEIAKVTTAIPLTEELNKKVLRKIKEITGKQITIKNTINPDIIGGFILRIGDIQYNASIAHKLQELKKQFEN